MKRLFIFIAAIFAAAVAFGQTPLPNDPEVRVLIKFPYLLKKYLFLKKSTYL